MVAVLTIVRTHYAFSQKMATGMNYFFHLRMFTKICLFAITLIRAGVAAQGPLVAVIKDLKASHKADHKSSAKLLL